MQPTEKVARHWLSVLELVQALGNVSATCRQRGMTRTQFYEYNTLSFGAAYARQRAIYKQDIQVTFPTLGLSFPILPSVIRVLPTGHFLTCLMKR